MQSIIIINWGILSFDLIFESVAALLFLALYQRLANIENHIKLCLFIYLLAYSLFKLSNQMKLQTYPYLMVQNHTNMNMIWI